MGGIGGCGVSEIDDAQTRLVREILTAVKQSGLATEEAVAVLASVVVNQLEILAFVKDSEWLLKMHLLLVKMIVDSNAWGSSR